MKIILHTSRGQQFAFILSYRFILSARWVYNSYTECEYSEWDTIIANLQPFLVLGGRGSWRKPTRTQREHTVWHKPELRIKTRSLEPWGGYTTCCAHSQSVCQLAKGDTLTDKRPTVQNTHLTTIKLKKWAESITCHIHTFLKRHFCLIRQTNF